MKIENYQFPKSSFLSLEKDCQLIIQKMLSNDNLKKLLYYSNKECLSMNKNYTQMPLLDQEATYSLIGNQIRLIPKLTIDSNILSYIIISFDNFTPSDNPQYRDNIITFDIICHFDQWNLGDFKLRPYKIAGELDGMFNNTHLSGIGTLQFLGANQLVLNDEFAGVSLMYSVTHGKDDQI